MADPGIAVVTELEDVAGVSEGSTSVSVNYGGHVSEVEVLVLPVITPVSTEPSPGSEAPTHSALKPAYPNPFSRTVTIPFQLASRQRVAVRVYDLLGREVRVLLDDELNAGRHTTELDAQGLASGIYFVRMVAGDYREVRMVTLLR